MVRAENPPAGYLQAVMSVNIKLHIFHNFQHHPCAQPEPILENQAIRDGLIFSHAIRVFLKQRFLLVCHRSFELIFIPTDQLQ